MAKALIVYYSRRGENYWNGSIKNLSKGNTEVVAEMIAELTGADLFQVETIKPFAEDYYTCIDEAKKELKEGIQPQLRIQKTLTNLFKSVRLQDYVRLYILVRNMNRVIFH